MAYSMEDEESSTTPTALYKALLNRFGDLEESHAKLREQMELVVQEREKEQKWLMIRGGGARGGGGIGGRYEEMNSNNGFADNDENDAYRNWGAHNIKGFFFSGWPYSKILQSMGHAIHICRPYDGKLTFWNRSAETLYGWKDYEVIGQRIQDLLIEDPIHEAGEKIIGKLSSGESWSGQLPFRKRSGEIFMALVTKSLLYEDGELGGIITVSSDAAIFNIINSEKLRTFQEPGHDQNREQGGFNMKKIQWLPKPQSTAMPSSVSALASKVFSRQRGEDDNYSVHPNFRNPGGQVLDTEYVESGKPPNPAFKLNIGINQADQNSKRNVESRFIQPSKFAAKLLEKLNVGGSGKEEGKSDQVHYSAENCSSNALRCNPNFPRESSLERPDLINEKRETNYGKNNPVIANKSGYGNPMGARNQNQFTEDGLVTNKNSFMNSWLECQQCSRLPTGNYLPPLGGENGEYVEAPRDLDNYGDVIVEKTKLNKKSDVSQSPPTLASSEESKSSSHGSLENSTKEKKFDCEIHWDDLHLGEEIGQGAFANVYRGVWNGSDVAIKVYMGSEYQEATILDYRKEISIMQRLRHPNVLLFMGAVYSPERLAIVTEFLPRGSLFKTLHKNKEALDIRRRLRMALDVVRGMNYLHHRNPPIVHRDLKSTNLLVDKNWTVKVGDFGLSKWKHATFVTARSGRGTPQWMAPEVLRNEPSDEKSDVFSFGVILWELMTESIPWSDLNSLQVVGVVGFMDRRLDIPETLDPRLASIIEDCWRSEPGGRPSFEELIPRMAELIQTFSAGAVQKNSKP
ncbi:hypothetical protein MKW94_027581 [Papaver nudicaule]|uniref:non-specific serine/threonine protein kinase n=1 Tax=Papaver nudicaule TaxID=74823 RepID=A0AA41SEQ4_PAPNU|nr:hypothetical protein [Papaver nudicaule]